VGRDDDLVALADADRLQRQVDGVRPAVDSDGVLGVTHASANAA